MGNWFRVNCRLGLTYCLVTMRRSCLDSFSAATFTTLYLLPELTPLWSIHRPYSGHIYVWNDQARDIMSRVPQADFISGMGLAGCSSPAIQTFRAL
jgi:hypothetical protein